jgi:hypothetical protein
VGGGLGSIAQHVQRDELLHLHQTTTIANYHQRRR